jgi:hypothetical protein
MTNEIEKVDIQAWWTWRDATDVLVKKVNELIDVVNALDIHAQIINKRLDNE